jgi:hypothetical protein
MDIVIEAGGRWWWGSLAALFVGRALDLLSTWLSTPRLANEANPIARRLGWRGGIALSVLISFGAAFVPVIAIILATTSVLVAAENFRSAWLMKSMGEHAYRDWYLRRVAETPRGLYLGCLLGRTVPFMVLGLLLACFSGLRPVPFGIGFGMIGYGLAVLCYTWLANRG